MDAKEICDVIVESAKEVRRTFTPGFEEKVYKNAMYIELTERGLSVDTEVPFQVRYKGHIVGAYKADMIVEKKVIVELKATNALTTINSVQLVNYLHATGIDDGLLINFGSEKLEIRHKDRIYHSKQPL